MELFIQVSHVNYSIHEPSEFISELSLLRGKLQNHLAGVVKFKKMQISEVVKRIESRPV
jgi:hypothetical protein